MMRFRPAPSLATLALSATAIAAMTAQEPAPQRASGGDASTVTAVVVDLVVRDRRGQPVTDLTADDFEVFEDGVRQQVGSFRVPVAQSAASPAAAAPPAASDQATVPPSPAGTPPRTDGAVVALVFDRLSPESRRFTKLAADRYVGAGSESEHTIGVFATDWGLDVVQGFTRDAALLRQALDTIGSRTGSQSSEARAQAREQMQRADQITAQLGSGGVGSGATAAAVGVDLQMAQMQQRMSETFSMLERDQAGYGVMNALTSVVNALKLVPGRKTVLFFSEGLVLPPNVQPRFLSLIDEANRANVAVYAMDAMGLRATSMQAEARDEINAYASNRLNTGERSIGAGGAASRYLEVNEDRLRMDPASGLGQLATETGGFLIQGSNNFDRGFTRVAEDIRAHYVLTYTSSTPGYDGKFRAIDVKVKRSGLSVAHRKGYYAVPPSADGAPVLAYEAPALALLESSPLPNTFPMTARALVFPNADADADATVPVLVAFDTKHLAYESTGGAFSAEAVVVARIRDGNGQVMSKTSDLYTLRGADAQLAASQAGRVVFFRLPTLPAGLYTLETMVYDTRTAKASVRISSLEVPPTTGAPRVSSLLVVQGVEKVPAGERDPANPLYFGELLLYPNLGEPISKATSRELAFAFAAQRGAAALTGATVSLVRSGQVVGQAPLTLDAPDGTGVIRQVGRLPMEALEPGAYEIRVAVQAGGSAVVRSARVSIVP